jgi:hypothetical protein
LLLDAAWADNPDDSIAPNAINRMRMQQFARFRPQNHQPEQHSVAACAPHATLPPVTGRAVAIRLHHWGSGSAENQDENGTGVPQIEVTPEMIEAAFMPLEDFTSGYTGLQETARRVFAAMLAANDRAPPQSDLERGALIQDQR